MEKQVNATEAARGFGDHLDDVLRGHNFVVTRRGRKVARLIAYDTVPEEWFEDHGSHEAGDHDDGRQA